MKKRNVILLLIFIITLAFRLYFAFQTPNLDYEAYFNVRQINHITSTGLPLYNDPLSYGGRTFIFTPIFQYILAFFNLFLPSFLVFKIIPNLFASSLVLIIYLISKKITENTNIALLTSAVSAFIPIYLAETINSVSVLSLTIPLIFLTIYSFMNLEKKKYIFLSVCLISLLALTHASIIFLIIGLILYLALIKLEHIKQKRAEIELVIFAIFSSLWVQFLIYKNAFLSNGPSVIWQNIPAKVLAIYFAETNILLAILNIGLVPVVCGIYVVYKYAFKSKEKNLYLLIGLIISMGVMLWFNLIQLNIGLMFLGIILTLLFSVFYKLFNISLDKSLLDKYKKWIFLLFILLFLITSVIPSYYAASNKIDKVPSLDETKALEWIGKNTPENSTILGTLNQGLIITEISQRKNMMDTNFLLIPNPTQRYDDLTKMYSTHYKIEAVDLFNKYDIDYVLSSPQLELELGIKEIKYIEDSDCFIPVYEDKIKIYKTICKVKET